MANYLKDCLKQVYQLQHPEKYFGNKNPICKSSWEIKLFSMLDNNAQVHRWSYESVQIPYFNPVKNRYTLYFPDVFCEIKQTNGTTQQFLLEVKPNKFLTPPTKPNIPKTQTPNSLKKYEKAIRRYQIDLINFKVNESKFASARSWCARHNITFLLITEKDVPSFVQ